MAATATRTGLFCVQCRHVECAAQSSENMICRFCEDGVPCPIAQRETKAGSSKPKNVATELPQHARSNGNGRSNSVAPSAIPAVRAKADGVSPHKRPCATLGCPNTCRVRNKYPYCTPCQQAGKHKNEAPAVLRQRLETANRGQLKELPPRLKNSKSTGGANGNGHRKNGNSEQFATLVVSEAHLDRFLTLLPIDRKAALVTEELSRQEVC